MISDNLTFLRKSHHFSQEEVAEQIGVTRQAVAKWESGETVPDLKNSAALAKLYDVTLDDLVNYDSSKKQLPIPPKGKYIFDNVTVGDRGQIIIPKKARDLFHIHPGDSLTVLGDIEQNGLALIKSEYFLAMARDILSKGGITYDGNPTQGSDQTL